MFRGILNDKIGNILCYFAAEIDNLSLTKALKLLYILDETAVKETGAPITWLEYKVWKNGPVADEIYKELHHNQKLCIQDKTISIDEFISITHKESSFPKNQFDTYLHPKKAYDFSEFSDYEIGLLNQIVTKYGTLSAKKLVEILHQEDSLWHKVVQQHGLQVNFELFKATSNYTIDFTELIEHNEFFKLSMQSAYESLQFHAALLEHNQLS